MTEIEKLKKENKILKEKLNIASLWMSKQIKESVKKISRKKIFKSTQVVKNNFARENLEEIITNKIRNYFGDFILMNVSSNFIDNIISAEIAYYELKQNPNFDGFSVISSYHKAIDIIIEQYITKGFRKFAKKKGQVHLRKNDLLEKSLHSVVNKNYILSIGRLYHILNLINSGKDLYDYVKCFKEYLEKYYYLKEALVDKNFIKNFEKIINLEIFGKKRHSGILSFTETRTARKLLIGDFKDKNSFIYLILKTQEIDY